MPARLLWVAVGLFGWAAVAAAQGDTGLLVHVPANLDTQARKGIQGRVNEALARGADRPSKVIFWFTPGDRDTSSDNYGECYELAKSIADWKDVNTVAFVSRKLTGHAVLPALCCNELAMSREAAVGEVVPAGAEPLSKFDQAGYELLLKDLRPAQFAVVRKMYDKNVRLMRGQKNKADWYFDAPEKAKFEKEGGVASDTKPVVDAGVVGLFPADRMGEFGLRKVSAQSVNDLAAVLDLAPGSLRDDPTTGRERKAFRYVLRDEVTPSVAETVARGVREVVRQGGTVLYLQLECDGGDAAAAADLANELYKFQHPEAGPGLRVVAFIPNNAHNTSVIVALGCSEVVMSTRKGMGEGTAEGTFGDFGPYMQKTKTGPETLAPLLTALADKQNLPPAVVQGMVDKELELVKVRGVKDRRRTAVMPRAQAEAEKADWNQEGVLKKKGELLKLTATEAKQLGLVKLVLDGNTAADLYAVEGVRPGDVKDATPAWLDSVRGFLRIPAVTVVLVIVGFIGLILELKVPGTTVPGIVAALCFILLFWAWLAVNQHLAWLAGLLFLFGLVLVLLEVFVFPGFGVPGVVGILAMLSAIVLVTMDKFPENQSQWIGLGAKMAMYVFALIGAAVAAFLIARFLPRVPVANRMMLAPTHEREAADPTVLPGAAQAAALLGAIGVTTTVLRPAGAVQFGEEFVDVVSDGGFIPAGTRVQVVEVEGTRIVVKEV